MPKGFPFPRLVYDPERRSLYAFLRSRRPEDVSRSEHASLRLGPASDRRLVALTLEETAVTRLGRLETAGRLPGASIGPHREFLDLALNSRPVSVDRKGADAILRLRRGRRPRRLPGLLRPAARRPAFPAEGARGRDGSLRLRGRLHWAL